MRTGGRKPDGTVTSDDAEYAFAWRKLGEEVEGFFPGYEVWGYDPDISLRHKDPLRQHNTAFRISADAALVLVTANRAGES